MSQPSSELVSLGSLLIEVERVGAGSPVLVVPSEEGFENKSEAVAALSREHEVIIAYPPGFGRSERPDWITQPDDLSYVLLDLLETLDLGRVPVIGFSLGGWVAAEMAVKNDSRIEKLVLVDPYGVKLGGPFDRDIADIWLLHPSKVAGLKWADPDKNKRDFTAWSDDDLSIVARNSESFARFCWEPYMHDPKLRRRLHRIKTPTLFIWGEKDGVTSVDYGRGFARLVPDSRFAVVENAGHFPHIEQPQAFLRELANFLN